MVKQSKLDYAWEQLFNKYDIADEIEKNGVFRISADQIKEFREPRLMTKFDWSDAKPKLFIDNHLSILPNTRGTYVIGKFNAYHKLKNQELKPITVRLPDWVKTFDNFNVTSEAVALNVAQMSGMIDYVLGHKDGQPLAVSTITGRIKSGIIDYSIDLMNNQGKYDFKVDNSQMEIDAGYEDLNSLAIIEAKSRIPKDFIIRQLYYPYRAYSALGTNKPVIPIYFTHADDIYTFHIFEFTDLNNYSSIRQVEQVSFIVEQSLDISLDEIIEISKNSKNEEDDYTFPQADSFTRLLNNLKYLKKPKNKFELAILNNFNPRQGDYYGNALCYLDMAYKDGNKYKLSELGIKLANMPNSNGRNRIIINQILNKKTFNMIFMNTIKNNRNFDTKYIADVILKYGKSVNSPVTATRRAATAKSWISWILNIASEIDA